MPYPGFTPQPDFGRFLKVVRREVPDRVPFVELFLDFEMVEALREAPLAEDLAVRWPQIVDLYYRLGYDYVPVGTEFWFPRTFLAADDTAGLTRGQRTWVDESHGVIETWEDFERYGWPTPVPEQFRSLEFAAKALPEGMRLVAEGPGGVLENVMWLMGYAPMSYAMADQPDLVEAVFTRVGEGLVQVYETLAQHGAVGALFLGDDMGFKTQTMISPDDLRTYVFPWQRRLAEIAHRHGKPFLLHSCGQLAAVMGDLIDYVGIDGKHSYEDVILSAAESKRLWGDRIAILGGVDMDILSRGTPEQVRARTREVVEACKPGGGFALGSGNTIANYVPVENYLAMLEEGWERGRY